MSGTLKTTPPNRKDGKAFIVFTLGSKKIQGWIEEDVLREAQGFDNWEMAAGFLLAKVNQTFNTLHRPDPALELNLKVSSFTELLDFLRAATPQPITAETLMEWAGKKAKEEPKVNLERFYWSGKYDVNYRSNSAKNEIIFLLLAMDAKVLAGMTGKAKEDLILDLRRYPSSSYENRTLPELLGEILDRIQNNPDQYPTNDLDALLEHFGLE